MHRVSPQKVVKEKKHFLRSSKWEMIQTSLATSSGTNNISIKLALRLLPAGVDKCFLLLNISSILQTRRTAWSRQNYCRYQSVDYIHGTSESKYFVDSRNLLILKQVKIRPLHWEDFVTFCHFSITIKRPDIPYCHCDIPTLLKRGRPLYLLES